MNIMTAACVSTRPIKCDCVMMTLCFVLELLYHSQWRTQGRGGARGTVAPRGTYRESGTAL